MYVVIRAGGIGTRLWPLSRTTYPKQLHALIGQHTLLQQSVERVRGLVSPDHIYVSCNQATANVVQQQLPDIPNSHLLLEPALRDTAAAVGLETITIAKHDPQAIIASLGSDHSITATTEFQRILTLAERTIARYPDHILCIGIQPTQPDTGYGYIELGEALQPEVFTVKSFKEKPDLATAERFVAAKHYLWNANMFVWRADTVLALYQRYLPDMYEILQRIQQQPATLAELYPTLPKIAVDYGIIEKAPNIIAIPGQFGWNDIGDWSRLKTELPNDTRGNVSRGDHIDLDSRNSVVFAAGNRTVTTIGLDNIVIVDTPDTVLVCAADDSKRVKELVEELKRQQRTDLL
ncbi:MAG: mannose-1-phosphate guanylyltransferase [Candidatus Kerfeldbacteria bacterium]|nr:mannose-1-phosphate guanylyltransferase [Candidatus Kerfeldbacteria bacterium]